MEDLDWRQTFSLSSCAWNVWQVVTCWNRFVQITTKPCFKLLASWKKKEDKNKRKMREENQWWQDEDGEKMWLTSSFLSCDVVDIKSIQRKWFFVHNIFIESSFMRRRGRRRRRCSNLGTSGCPLFTQRGLLFSH